MNRFRIGKIERTSSKIVQRSNRIGETSSERIPSVGGIQVVIINVMLDIPCGVDNQDYANERKSVDSQWKDFQCASYTKKGQRPEINVQGKMPCK